MQPPGNHVGIHVSKHHLDVVFLGAPKAWRTTNDAAGHAALAKRVARLDRPRLVCEATGGYTRALVAGMAARAIPVSRINPRQVRDFGHRPKFILSDAAGDVEGPARRGGSPRPTAMTRP